MSINALQALFSDAEAGEDCAEDFVGADFAGDFAEVVHAFSDVLADEVSADADVQSVDSAGDCFACVEQCTVVARIGYYHLVGVARFG